MIKKNIAVLLIGAIVGGLLAGGTMLVAHNRSKAQTQKAYNIILKEKNTLIAQCISEPKYTNNNEFNPNIAKNKKGTIVIDLLPKIKQDLKAAQPEKRVLKEGDTIQGLTLIHTKHLTRRQKRRIYK